jgi:hypothetical protein
LHNSRFHALRLSSVSDVNTMGKIVSGLRKNNVQILSLVWGYDN